MTPRREYPRPQLVRARWQSLNGDWELAYDEGDRGLRDGWERGHSFDRRVVVPFPLESELSGVGDPTPPPVVWYRRTFELPAAWRRERVRLHVGACDYEARVFLAGRFVGGHRGGYAPWSCELGPALTPGVQELVLRVSDPPTWSRPRGKQTAGAFRTPVDYDTVTGIWQSVWLEPLPAVSLDEVWTRWDAARGELAVHVALSEPLVAHLEVSLHDAVGEVARARGATAGRGEARVPVAVRAPHLWSPEDPHLYRLEVVLFEGERALDRATQPVGLRSVHADGGRILLNGEPRYLRGVLDQGYFPGGWYTAADDEDLRRDVVRTRELGFDLARKHQKAEDPRWLHWCDRLGLLVWSEMPSGRDFTTELVTDLSREWAEIVRRDRAFACVVAWVPFNESWGVWSQARRPEERAFVEAMVGLTRTLDPTRLVVGNDGWEFSAGDLWTLHLYEEAGEGDDVAGRLRALLADPHGDVLPEGGPLGRRAGALPGADPRGLPLLLTECGGVGYVPPGAAPPLHPLFAYGDMPRSPEELEARIVRIADALRAAPELAGFVWTQLTDVQQEVNGLLDFERRPKLPLGRLRAIFGGVGPPVPRARSDASAPAEPLPAHPGARPGARRRRMRREWD